MSSSFKRRSDAATIPAASSFLGGGRGVRKLGRLSKSCPRGWLLGACCWKRRFCVLDGSKLYYYENENSTGRERSCGVVNLDYFDVCEESKKRDKRASNIFVISVSVRGLFDLHQKHTFAADTLPEMNEWIHHIRTAISDARNKRKRRGNESPATSKEPKTSVDRPTPPPQQENLNTTEHTRLYTPTKNRNRGPKGRRLPQRKSLMPSRGRDVQDGPVRANSMSALECFSLDDEMIRKDAWLDVTSGSHRATSHDIYKYSSSEDSLSPPPVGVDTIHTTRTLPLGSQPPLTSGQSVESKKKMDQSATTKTATAPPSSARFKDLELRLGQLQKGLEGLESEVSSSRADIATVHGQVIRVQKEADRAVAMVTEMRESSAQQEKEMVSLMKEIKELFVDARKMKTDSENARREFFSLKEECQTVMADLKIARKSDI